MRKKENAFVYPVFLNKPARGMLSAISDSRNNLFPGHIKGQVPAISDAWTVASAQHRLIDISPPFQQAALIEHIATCFKNEWPAVVLPDEEEAMVREIEAARKAKNIRDKWYGPSLRYFTEQCLRAWPMENGSLRREGGIFPEDYPGYAQSLVWYLLEAEDAEGNRRCLGPHDLNALTLQAIQEDWSAAFPSAVTSDFLQKCDNHFLDSLIPDDTDKEDRHPDTESAIHHAEICGTGFMDDGETTWTLRRINSKEAAMAYGNPSGKTNGSALCFTWSGSRENHFSTYREDLLMISTDDAKSCYFMNLREAMFTDLHDRATDLDFLIDKFPGLDTAVGASISGALGYMTRSERYGGYVFLHVVKNTPLQEFCSPAAEEYLGFLMRSFASQYNLSGYPILHEVARVLDAARDVPAWEDVCTPFVEKDLPFMMVVANQGNGFKQVVRSVKGVPVWEKVIRELNHQYLPHDCLAFIKGVLGPDEEDDLPVSSPQPARAPSL